MSRTNEAEPEGPRCRVCAEVIRREARVCKVCGNYQDWRRFLGLSTSVLALLVALVTVVASSLPVITATLAGDFSNLRLTFQRVADDSAFFSTSNSGTKPASITRAELVISYRVPPQTGRTEMYFDLIGENSNWLVQPGETKQVVFRIPHTAETQLRMAWPGSDQRPTRTSMTLPTPDTEAWIRVTLTQYGGEQSILRQEVRMICTFESCRFIPPRPHWLHEASSNSS
jgi:hypothetical protein